MKITEPWNELKFLYSNHSHFLLLTCPHSFVLLKKSIKCVKIYLKTFFMFLSLSYLRFEIVSCINQCISLTINHNNTKECGQVSKRKWGWLLYKTMSPIHGLVNFVPLNNINECLTEKHTTQNYIVRSFPTFSQESTHVLLILKKILVAQTSEFYF